MVLWVDDKPSNNINERFALSQLGINFVLATSTDEAKSRMMGQRFDLIISDFSQPKDQDAGYGLLNYLNEKQIRIPYIIYAGSANPAEIALARNTGAFGQTNAPKELYGMVLEALQRSRAEAQPIIPPDVAR
jgi:CheY-like chemotaxis protein